MSTLTELIEAFNERLIALEVSDTGLRTTVDDGYDPKWGGWHIIDFSVRPAWRAHAIAGNTGNERWSEGEPAYPTPEWETITDNAIYNDDIIDLQVPPDSYSFMRFAVDPARIDRVLELVRRAPVVSAEQRSAELVEYLSEA
jgi:hypothetical protein